MSSTAIVETPTGPRLALPGARLLVLSGPDRRRALGLDKEEIVVGSAASADLVLSDETVSRHHFALRRGDAGFRLTDLGSRNGTFVDGRRVEIVHLAPGDVIEVGKSRLRLEAARETVTLQLSRGESFGPVIGRSLVMRRLFATLEEVAGSDTTILLTGESGTGKDLIAHAIHDKSPRAGGPFVVLDCGAIAAGVVESELFGHVEGAFTGAVAARLGAFREADRGTIFIDEIGELARELQPRLLRALESRQVKPVGGSAVAVDVRVIAATNRDLKRDVNSGSFREDLFYRLNVVSLTVPPLRERLDDVPLLAARLWHELTGEPEAALPAAFLPALAQHAWPGNVRELRNRIERALVFNRPVEISSARSVGQEPFRAAKQAVIDAFERQYLAALMARSDGNQSAAARLAELDRPHLIKLLKKHGLAHG